MHRGSVLIAFALLVLIPTLASPAERDSAEPHRVGSSLALRNWIPALASHPPEVEEGEIQTMALPSAASHFIAINPCRVVDTRRPDGPHGGPIMTGGIPRPFTIPTGPCTGIPPAAAYSLNIAVTGSAPGSPQFLTAYPAGTARPVIATMNFDGGKTVSNAALVPADDSGSVEMYVSADSHVIVDINGYIKEGVVTSVSPGTGLTGGGMGAVSLGIAEGGVGASQLGPSAVTSGAIADSAVTGAKIANDQVVRSIKGLTDAVDIVGAGGNMVSAAGSTITITAPDVVPSGSAILGFSGDTTLIGAGYGEVGPSREDLWSPVSTTGAPSPRRNHSAIWTGTSMIVWGGFGGAYLDTGGLYDPLSDTWSPTTTSGAPTARGWHTAVWIGNRMIVWGGFDGTNLSTGGQYDPVSDAWSPTATAGAPSARHNHTAVWTGTRMIVWGGSEAAYVNTGGLYDPAANLWSATATTDAPSGRILHTMIWTGASMIVWGGFGGTDLNTGARYDQATNTWTPVTTSGAPSPRNYHTAVWTGTRMIVWGGWNGTMNLDTGGRYDPATNTWRATSTGCAPAGRSIHTAVWTGLRMIVWGGNSSGNDFIAGGQYDPSTDSWNTTTTAGAPAGRNFHTAVWTGDTMIVWGGAPLSGSPVVNTGGRWRSFSLFLKN